VRSRIDALRRRDVARKVFGAAGHGYELQPVLTDPEVRAVEAQWAVQFPDDYRTFLVEIGRGGAGPAYGIFPLVLAEGVWRWEGDGGDLVSQPQKPFPYSAAWNDAFREREDDEDEDSYWAEHDAWGEAVYWKPEKTHGAVCLCHEGCAMRDWLVVTGPERGHIWIDDRANDEGLMPRNMKGQRVTFSSWYMHWLSEAEREVDANARQ
jgi:hypothetical protein